MMVATSDVNLGEQNEQVGCTVDVPTRVGILENCGPDEDKQSIRDTSRSTPRRAILWPTSGRSSLWEVLLSCQQPEWMHRSVLQAQALIANASVSRKQHHMLCHTRSRGWLRLRLCTTYLGVFRDVPAPLIEEVRSAAKEAGSMPTQLARCMMCGRRLHVLSTREHVLEASGPRLCQRSGC